MGTIASLSTARSGSGLRRGAVWPWQLIAVAIAISPFAFRLSELLFLIAVFGGLAVAQWRMESPRQVVGELAWPLVAVSWVALRVESATGLGLHSLSGPHRFPVTLFDFVPFLLAFVVLRRVPLGEREGRWLFWTIALTVPFWCIFAVAQVELGSGGGLSWSPLGLPLLQVDLSAYKTARVSSSLGNWNLLGLMMLYCIVAALALLMARSRSLGGEAKRWRQLARLAGLGALLGVALGLLILSGSRSSWLALVAIVLVLLFLGRARLRPLWLLTPTLLASLLLFFAVKDLGAPSRWARGVVPEMVTERVTGDQSRFDVSELGWRLDAYRCAMQLARERPWKGFGTGEYAPECEARLEKTLNHAHNVILELAADLGVPFAVLFSSWILWLMVRGLRRIIATDSDEVRAHRIGFLLITVPTVVSSQLTLALLHDHRPEIIFWAALAALGAPSVAPLPPDS